MAGFEELVRSLFPFAGNIAGWLGVSRLAQAVVLFPALYGLFYTLTPASYRYSACPKWPGALFVTLWWMTTTDRKSVVWGKSVSVGVDLGGSRRIKNKHEPYKAKETNSQTLTKKVDIRTIK